MSQSGKPVDVSVIIPTYNRAGLVVEAIESVLRQTTPPREIIVVDDGSTDDTSDVLASFGNRIVAVRQENQGVGTARNLGMAMARGKYIAFLDSDDLWLNFKLELQVAIMENNPKLGLLFSDFLIMRDNGSLRPHGLQTWPGHARTWEQILDCITVKIVEVPTKEERVRLYSGQMYRILLEELYVLTSSVMVRTSCLFSDICFPESIHVYEDWEFFARVARTSDAGFIECETSVNRGGNDRPRLTDASVARKAENRLRMIGAVWKADQVFMTAYGAVVSRVEAEQCLVLARAHLLDSNAKDARAALGRYVKLGDFKQWRTVFALTLCTVIPGCGGILRQLRTLRSCFRAALPTPKEDIHD